MRKEYKAPFYISGNYNGFVKPMMKTSGMFECRVDTGERISVRIRISC